jgi:hypothetical protein
LKIQHVPYEPSMNSVMEGSQTCYTPTDTSSADTEVDLPPYHSILNTAPETCPWQGGTFVIRDLDTKLIITLKDSIISLQVGDGHLQLL